MTEVLDQVPGNFIHLEGLLKLFVRVESVSFRLELLCVSQLVSEVVRQVLDDCVVYESLLRCGPSQDVLVVSVGQVGRQLSNRS